MHPQRWPYELLVLVVFCQLTHPLAGLVWVLTLTGVGLVSRLSLLLAILCCLRCWLAVTPAPSSAAASLAIPVRVVARVAEPPQWLGDEGCRFVADIEFWCDRPQGEEERWLVECSMPPAEVALGERWLLQGKLMEFAAPAFPGDRDRGAWWRQRGVTRRLRCSDERFLRPARGLAGWRYRLTQRFSDHAPHPRAQLLSAIVFGDGSRLEQATLQSFRLAGASHLLVASGANVALVVGWVFLLGKVCGYGPRRCCGVALLLVPGYVAMAGASPSLVRAGAMATLALLARWSGRSVSVGRCLVLGADGVLLWDPLFLHDLGFQLSFAAVASLAWLAPALGRLPLLLSASIACWIGLLPWSVGLFHSFQPFSPLANLWLVPLVEGLLPMGALVALADQLHPCLGEWALTALNPWLWLVERSVEFWASCPQWELWVPAGYGWLGWLFLVLGCCLSPAFFWGLPLVLWGALDRPNSTGLEVRWLLLGSGPVVWISQDQGHVAWSVRSLAGPSLDNLRRSQAASPWLLQLDLEAVGCRRWRWHSSLVEQNPGRLAYRSGGFQLVLARDWSEAGGATLQLVADGGWSWQGGPRRRLEPGHPWRLRLQGRKFLVEPWIRHEPLRAAVFHRLGAALPEL